VAAVSASLGLAQTTAAAAPAAASPAAGPPALAGQPAAALAAAVTAMVQDGKNTLQIRLDPPELGSLSIHLAVGQDAKVNVLLLAAVPQTATAFAAGADDLRQAFAASGLALGQLNVGGESGAGRDDNRRQSTARPVQLLGDATNSAAVGVRAIA
jgi:flagellar hook-length control protein FliK